MKKIVFLFGLIFCSSGFAQSKWVYMYEVRKSQHFMDVNSMLRNGDTVTYWKKENYLVREDNVLSNKAQVIINCRTRDYFLRWLILYDDQDNNGKILASFAGTNPWAPIPPESLLEEDYRLVCKYK